MKNYQKLIIVFLFIIPIILSNVLGVSFLYDIEKNNDSYIIDESSISTSAPTPEFNFQSTAQILMEPKSGKIIYANNENEKLIPASVTKIMTLLLIMENIDSGKLKYTDKVVCSANASGMGGSQIWFKEGEELTVDEALKCICVVSANDVTVAMAEKIGGTESNFVNMMNKKAEELNMTNTHFANSHGVDEEGHYTTALDIAIMSRELINNHPDILKYTSIWMDSIRNGQFGLSSTNKLIRYYEGATGLKTGFTSQALYNLSATATRNGTTFIAVVMKAPTSQIRQQECSQLLDYAFATYESKNIIGKGEIVDNIKINKNVNGLANICIKDDISYLVEKGCHIETSQRIVYDQNLTAPLKKGDTVGKVEIINNQDGQIIGESKLIVDTDIEKSGYIDYLKHVFFTFILRDNNV